MELRWVGLGCASKPLDPLEAGRWAGAGSEQGDEDACVVMRVCDMEWGLLNMEMRIVNMERGTHEYED